MRHPVFVFFAFIFIFLFSACSKPMPRHGIDVFLEAPSGSNAFGLHQSVTMPVTGVKARITTPPILDIDAFTNTEIKLMDYPQLGIVAQPGIRFRVKKDKMIRVYQASGEALSEGRGAKRFFLVVDGKPIGYCRIWSQIREDDLFFIIDSSSEGKELMDELEELKFTLNEYILARREYMEDKGR